MILEHGCHLQRDEVQIESRVREMGSDASIFYLTLKGDGEP